MEISVTNYNAIWMLIKVKARGTTTDFNVNTRCQDNELKYLSSLLI